MWCPISSSTSDPDDRSGMEMLFITLTYGCPCNLFRKVSLYLIGMWGHSCLLLAEETVDWPLVLSGSESEIVPEEGEVSVEPLVVGDKGVELVVVGDEGSEGRGLWSSALCWRTQFKETRCMSN